MQTSVKALLLGTAMAVIASAVTPAVARDAQERVLTIQLPGGGLEEIHYTGDVAPQVFWVPSQAMSLPWTAVSTDIAASFAALEQMSSLLDQQAAAMMKQVADVPVIGGAHQWPAGASGYSIVSTFSSNGACTQTTQITYMGNGVKPRTVSSTSGKCGPGGEGGVPAEYQNAPPSADVNHTIPRTLEVKATDKSPFAHLVREAAWHDAHQHVD